MELILDHLRVTLAGRAVLHDITATLQPGRVTAIVGPNGAGKSSLIRTAAALIAPRSGSAMLGDRAIAGLDPRERARLLGYLPQDAVVHWDVPAADIVALGRLPWRVPFAGLSADDFDAVASAMHAAGTTGLADRPINQLSGGERARVLLARVLAGTPRWLLADEPLASLDPAHQIDMLDRLRAVAGQGSGVVIVLHDLAQAARIADDVLVLQDGRIVAHGAVEQALTPSIIANVFEIEARWLEADGRRVLVPLGRV